MNDTSSILLIGMGTAGCEMAARIRRAFGEDLRYILADTDASSNSGDHPFLLLGGRRLSGRSSGGDFQNARLAAEDSISSLKDHLEDVRLVVFVTALGGATGAAGTLEATKYLSSMGIPTIVFGTIPFAFEGENAQRTSRGVMALIQEFANASFFIPLDNLVASSDNMEESLRIAIDTLSQGVTLFWRLVKKPGFIKLDVERIRHFLSKAGRGRFSSVSVQGTERAVEAVKQLTNSKLLTTEGAGKAQSILCGVLAGNDLRLSELTTISEGITEAFGKDAEFQISTVNDELNFCGRIAVVVMIFEQNAKAASLSNKKSNHDFAAQTKAMRNRPLGVGQRNKGRFFSNKPTFWHGEDLDTPTFIRRNITLDF
jgi:cell division GTPase FtsZ